MWTVDLGCACSCCRSGATDQLGAIVGSADGLRRRTGVGEEKQCALNDLVDGRLTKPQEVVFEIESVSSGFPVTRACIPLVRFVRGG